MTDSRTKHMLGLSNGSLVVCGGENSFGYKNKCEKYDQGQDNWIQGAETLEEDKSFFQSVQLDDNRIWIGRKFGICEQKEVYILPSDK